MTTSLKPRFTPVAALLTGLFFFTAPAPSPAADTPPPVAVAAVKRPDGTPRLSVVLPTANDALFRGEMSEFYQYIERNFHDQVSYPWEGGQYGFVRDPVDSPVGMLYTRFHEGIDIKPTARDARGEPLDDVVAIADGRVVHASVQPGGSNYGRYIVVEHIWDRCAYYSLYAHLSEIVVSEGSVVTQGQKIARMGHTGTGIDRARSHVHLEINLMLNTRFDRVSASTDPTDPNKHGNYHGFNLAGIDVSRFYLALRKNPNLTMPQFLAEEEIYFRALVPAEATAPDLLKLYPWMGASTVKTINPSVVGTPAPIATAQPASWEISFTRSGLPLRVLSSPNAVNTPVLLDAKPSAVPYWEMTHRLLYGSGALPTLSPYGMRLVSLIGRTDSPPPNATPLPNLPPASPAINKPDRAD